MEHKRKLYIAGPMRGYDNFNFPAFDKAAVALEDAGFVAVSPADMDRLYEGWTFPPKDLEVTVDLKYRCIRRDLNFILSLNPMNGDGIYLLDGWKDSQGAMVECALANFLGLSIFEQGQDNDPIQWDEV